MMHRKSAFLLAMFVTFFLVARTGLSSDNSFGILDRARKYETDGMLLLGEHLRFEDSLVSEDNDRVLVFLSIPHGARMIADEISITLNGKLVHRHTYSTSELMLLQSRATQLFYASRLPQGEHVIKIDVKAIQGKVVPMGGYLFVKGRTTKYLDVQIAGAPARQIVITDW